MNRNLNKLVQHYNAHISNEYYSAFNARVIGRKRSEVYGNLWAEDFEFSDVLDECLTFLSYLSCVLKQHDIGRDYFNKVLKMSSKVYACTEGLIDDVDCLIIINAEIDMLSNVLDVLRKSPHRLGVKLKDLRAMIEEVKALKDNFMEDDDLPANE